MYCKSYKATISTRCCILRQDLASKIKNKVISSNGTSEEEEENGGKVEYKLGTFKKCLECKRGNKVKENPYHWKYDLDVKRLMRTYYPKPEKIKLQRLKKFSKVKLQRMDAKQQRRKKDIYD